MPNILDGITAADLTAYARSVPDPAEFTLSRFLPEVKIQGIKYRIRNTFSSVNAARFRAYDAETPISRPYIRTKLGEGMLPPVGEKGQIGELETLLEQMARGADNQPAIDQAFDLAGAYALAIRTRMEVTRGQLLATGTYELPTSDGHMESADWALKGTHKVTAATVWSNPAALAITDEQNWRAVVKADTIGSNPTAVITSTKVQGWLSQNIQYQTAYLGAQNLRPLNPAEINTVRANWSLPPLTIYDTQVPVDTVLGRVIPDNLFIMLVENQFGQTQFGTTAHGLILARGAAAQITRDEAPGIVVVTEAIADPPSEWVIGAANAAPIPFNMDQLLIATVGA